MKIKLKHDYIENKDICTLMLTVYTFILLHQNEKNINDLRAF